MTLTKSLLAAGIMAALTACSPTPESSAVTDKTKVTEAEQVSLNPVFNAMYARILALDPEMQSYLGIKDNYESWTDISPAGLDAKLALNKTLLEEINALETATMSDADALSHTLAKRKLSDNIADDTWRLHTYPVNQMFGVHSSVPSLLINAHQIESSEDAKAYIARLNGVADLMDQVTKNMDLQAEKGIVAPAFTFQLAINDSKNLLTGAPFTEGEDSTLWADFTQKVSKLDNKDQLMADAKKALLESVKPGYEQLIAWLETAKTQYSDENGVWALPNGDAYYASLLKEYTTTDLSADEVHNIGLAEVDAIHEEMRGIMKKVGFEGTLSEFFMFMRDDEQFYFPNTAEGKAAYLKQTDDLIAGMKARLDDLFITKPKADLLVKAVEPFREKSAGKAFYYLPAPDGSRPGTYYVNLYDMKEMPIYQMEALAYHEALPGHHMQIAISQEIEGLPDFRRFDGYTSYIEGWGLYSEHIPKEMGFYTDPYSDFGRLAMALWRAGRLVVDTGLHAKKWTKEQATQYLVQNTPNPERDCARAIERYMVLPGQATSYYIGMLEIIKLREQAKAELGEAFDIREYHDVILKNGALPLDILAEQVAIWVSTKQTS